MNASTISFAQISNSIILLSVYCFFFHSCLDDIQLSVFERQPEKIILPLLRLLANQFSIFHCFSRLFIELFSPMGCIAQNNHFSFTTRFSVFPTISLFPLGHFSWFFLIIPQFHYFEPFSFFCLVTFFAQFPSTNDFMASPLWFSRSENWKIGCLVWRSFTERKIFRHWIFDGAAAIIYPRKSFKDCMEAGHEVNLGSPTFN